MSRIAVSGYYGFDNFGDDAILFTLLQNFKQMGHQVTVFSKNPSSTSEKYNVNAVQTFSIFQLIKTLKNCNVLISGGGSLLQDVTSKKSLVYYLGVLFIAQLFKKKTIIFAQGIGPVNNNFLQIITKKILKNADYISVRDEKSLFLLRGWGLNPVLVNDPVWALPVNKTQKQDILGIQLRAWDNLSDEFLCELAKLVSEKYPTKKIRVLSFQNNIDLQICEKFKSLLLLQNPEANVEVIENRYLEQIVKALSECDLLVAMRYHAILIGLKLGIKSLALCYDIKVQTIAEENNIPYVMLNAVDDLKKKFEAIERQEMPDVIKKFSFDEINGMLE